MANMVEYLVVVGIVGIGGAVGYRELGTTAHDVTRRETACISGERECRAEIQSFSGKLLAYVAREPPPSKITLRNGTTEGALAITVDRAFGGAITRVTYGGVDYVDDGGDVADKGRQLQYAWSYNGFGECFNPTEAGDVHQAGSEVTRVGDDGRSVTTSSKPTTWYPAQSTVAPFRPPSGCGDRQDVVGPAHGSGQPDTLDKTVSLVPGAQNAFDITAKVGLHQQRIQYRSRRADASVAPGEEPTKWANIEAPTGYLRDQGNVKFDTFYAVRLDENERPYCSVVKVKSSQHDLQNGAILPDAVAIVVADRSGDHAIAVSDRSGKAPEYYALYRTDDGLAKWSVVHQEQIDPRLAGGQTATFQTRAAVGSVQDALNGVGYPGVRCPGR